MSFVNPQAKEINCKIVYCGPAFSGKSTNLRQIHEKVAKEARGKFLTITERDDRTLTFDFLPLTLGKIKGYNIRLHLYTVPGQPQFEASRRIILKGVDGVVFVADSQVEKMESDLTCWKDLQRDLRENEVDFKTIPMVLQYNKRDLKEVAPIEELTRLLNGREAPHLESVALRGEGVVESLQLVAKQVLKNLKD